jgi:hypothetical protein
MNTENKTLGACLVVATNGHVWAAKTVELDERFAHLNTARIVRTWGTTQGLNELVNGPTKNTVLDAIAPVVSVANIALIALIPVSDAAWEKYFNA